MTNMEIEKALELCGNEKLPCQECAYGKTSMQGHNCRNALIRDTAEYINRLKEQNYDMYCQYKNLQTYIANHEDIWKWNAEIDKAKVIKNTAKDILQEVYTNVLSRQSTDSISNIDLLLDSILLSIQNKAQEYGVEVDDE